MISTVWPSRLPFSFIISCELGQHLFSAIATVQYWLADPEQCFRSYLGTWILHMCLPPTPKYQSLMYVDFSNVLLEK